MVRQKMVTQKIARQRWHSKKKIWVEIILLKMMTKEKFDFRHDQI
jgi:hypothetical protein